VRNARGLAAAFGSFGLFWGAWASSLPEVKSSTGVSEAELGLALLAIGLAALPTMILAGRIADRAGSRLLAAALVAFGATAMLPGLARSFPVLAGFLVLLGAASGALDVAINADASRIESALGVRVMDGLHASFSAGVVVGGVGGGLLRKADAHPSAILAGVGVLVILAAAANRGETYASPTGPRSRSTLGPKLVVIGAVLAVAFLVENGLEVWSALFLERALHSSPAVGGLGPGLFAAAMATGRMLAQRLERSSVAGRMTFAGCAAAGGLLLAATAGHPAVALSGFVVAGGGLSLSAPTLFGAAGRLGGQGGRGAAVSTAAVLGYLGFLAGPPLFGTVAGASSLRGGFLFLCGAALLLGASAPALRRVAGESD
jgi:Major Facilitator Superfamily